MSYQVITLANDRDQVLVRTPWGDTIVVSAQIVGNKQHIYVTPPEGYEQRPGRGATTIFERELKRLATYEEGVEFAETVLHD